MTDAGKYIETSDKYKLVFDFSPEAIVIIDNKGTIIEMNDRITEWMGCSREEIVGSTIFNIPMISTKGKVDIAANFASRMLGKDVSPYEIQFVAKDGSERYGVIKAKAFTDQDGKNAGEVVLITDTTEERKTRNKLSTSESRLQSIFYNAAEAIFTTEAVSGRLVSINPAGARMFGYNTPDEAIKGITNVTRDVYLNPKDREFVVNSMKKDGEVRNFEVALKKKDGSFFWSLLSGKAMQYVDNPTFYFEGSCVDITDRVNQERILTDERDKVKLYLDIAGVMIISINKDETISLANEKCAEVIGLKVDRIVGKNWFDNFIPNNIRQEVRAVFHKILNGEIEAVKYFENIILNAKGEERIVYWHNSYSRDDKGDIIGTLSSGEDITERKKTEKVAKDTQMELEVKVSELEKLNQLMVGRELRMAALKKEYEQIRSKGGDMK